ncbi:MAG: hypothetical protein U1F77_11325 [Kiritimatiellia bacterium]
MMVICLLSSCGGKENKNEQDWLGRFRAAGAGKHTIVSLSVTPKKGGGTYVLKEPAELAALYKTFCKPNLSHFLETNATAPIYYFDYQCVFGDGEVLEYPGYIKPFKDRTYFAIYLPETGGFMEGLNITIRIESILSDSELKKLFGAFPNITELPDYRIPEVIKQDLESRGKLKATDKTAP